MIIAALIFVVIVVPIFVRLVLILRADQRQADLFWEREERQMESLRKAVEEKIRRMTR